MERKRRIKRADKKDRKEKAKPLETRAPATYKRPPSEASNTQKAASRSRFSSTIRVGAFDSLLNPVLVGFQQHSADVTAVLYSHEAKVRSTLNYILRDVFRQNVNLQGDYSIKNIGNQLMPQAATINTLQKLIDLIAASVLETDPVNIPGVSASGFGFLYQELVKMIAANAKTIAVLNLKRVLDKKIQSMLSVNLDPSVRSDLVAMISSLVCLVHHLFFIICLDCNRLPWKDR